MRVSGWRGYRYSRIEQTRNRANRREQMRLNAMQCPANVGYSCVVVHKQTRGGNEALVVAGIIVEEHHVANSMDSIGDHLNKADNAYKEAINKLSKGSGHLVGQAEKLRKLGLDVNKKIPEKFISDTDSDSDS